MPKRFPFKCNFCDGSLMLYQIFVSEALLAALKEVCQTEATDVFKVQKCKKCGRTYIWAEPPEPSNLTQKKVGE
jgi:hypothetical protein